MSWKPLSILKPPVDEWLLLSDGMREDGGYTFTVGYWDGEFWQYAQFMPQMEIEIEGSRACYNEEPGNWKYWMVVPDPPKNRKNQLGAV